MQEMVGAIRFHPCFFERVACLSEAKTPQVKNLKKRHYLLRYHSRIVVITDGKNLLRLSTCLSSLPWSMQILSVFQINPCGNVDSGESRRFQQLISSICCGNNWLSIFVEASLLLTRSKVFSRTVSVL